MDKPIVIFVSSVMRKDELHEERLIAEKAVRELEMTEAWLFELRPASSENVKISYLSAVVKSDIFVQILEKSITTPVIEEYETAKRCKIPRLIFIKKVHHRSEELTSYISTISERWKEFSNGEELFHEIKKALTAEVTKGFREGSKSNKKNVNSHHEHVSVRTKKMSANGLMQIGVNITDMASDQQEVSKPHSAHNRTVEVEAEEMEAKNMQIFVTKKSRK